VDRLGDFLLSQGERPLSNPQKEFLNAARSNALPIPPPASRLIAAYHKTLTRQVRRTSTTDVRPQLVSGEAAPEHFTIRENGVRFELSFSEGYSVGLFLDQRDNRRRFLTGHVAAGFSLLESERRNAQPEILNAFAYTCGFSLCAALAGAKTTSLDLSKKYLEWGRRNFALNGLDPGAHDFIHGDAFGWLKRLAKKGRKFDVVVLDPPTFSQSKEHGVFRVEKDYEKLVALILPLVKAGGVLFASTNAAGWPAEQFLASVAEPIRAARRKIVQEHYAPQPPDFPITRPEPAYLKTVWLRID
jgi:23S rRNA (cytosine1962-C5)-methyltransferase